jgi:hypothetical protein
MTAHLVDDLESAEKLLDEALDKCFAALELVEPVSKPATEEVERAINAGEQAHDFIARAVRALDGTGL